MAIEKHRYASPRLPYSAARPERSSCEAGLHVVFDVYVVFSNGCNKASLLTKKVANIIISADRTFHASHETGNTDMRLHNGDIDGTSGE